MPARPASTFGPAADRARVLYTLLEERRHYIKTCMSVDEFVHVKAPQFNSFPQTFRFLCRCRSNFLIYSHLRNIFTEYGHLRNRERRFLRRFRLEIRVAG